MNHTHLSLADQIFNLFETRGNATYGEDVTVLQHSLQSAHFAREAGVSEALIVAALLHDIGHLIHTEGEDIAERGVDAEHEDIGDEWLSAHFPAEITEPARLHVAAKRYLCAVNSAYLSELSEASVLSLSLQGGPMTLEEQASFEKEPFFQDALTLRKFDDLGKEPSLEVAPLESYRELIEQFAFESNPV